MKFKLLFAIATIAILFVLTSASVSANTFRCVFANGLCQAQSIDCDILFQPNYSLCGPLSDNENLCNAPQNQSRTCIPRPDVGGPGQPCLNGGCHGGAQCDLTAQPPICKDPNDINNPPPAGGTGSTINGSCGSYGEAIDTAIGCIPIQNRTALIGFILRWGVSIAGGIAMIFFVVAGFQIMTSAGDPQKLKAGQELLTSVISGVILLILSIFILRIVGVDILGLPFQ